MDPVIFRLRLEEKKRQHKGASEDPTPVIKIPEAGIVIIIGIGAFGTIVEVHHQARIQPVIQGVADLGRSPDIEIIAAEYEVLPAADEQILLSEARAGAFVAIRIGSVGHMLLGEARQRRQEDAGGRYNLSYHDI